MVKAIPDILARIVEQKRLELSERETNIEERGQRSISQRRDFLGALTGRRPAVIAEIKQASPSKGLLSRDFDPASIARTVTKKAAQRPFPF